MKLDSDLQFSKKHLERLNDSQRNLISSREKEIENLDKMYEEKKYNERYNGEAELLDIRDQNEAEIAEQLVKKQERLSNIKMSFDDSKRKLDKEQELLTKNNQEKIKDLNSVYENKFNDTFERVNTIADDINTGTQDTLRRLETENLERISQATFQNKIMADEKSIENDRKLLSQERTHKSQQRTAEKDYARKNANIVMEHENELINQNFKLKSQRKELENIQLAEMQNMTAQHKDLLLQEDKSFKEKYSNISKEHQSVLDRIKSRFTNQINSLLNSQMKFKANIENKDENSFYSITALEPTVTKLDGAYELSLEVPEYEKENVRLTAQGRDLSITLTRKFSDSIESEDGTKNKSSRSEIFSKKIPTEDLLNSKEVTQKYHDGVLTFNIATL
ncbi:Hsp20/alpha crystallin family protein [Halobacteriovorax sp.]|uniref:Hsp20/alpha crystallin family protein n=1 Tax=Halobacteriovorax sp. TaxID=2020862 RepID=UPI0035670EB4